MCQFSVDFSREKGGRRKGNEEKEEEEKASSYIHYPALTQENLFEIFKPCSDIFGLSEKIVLPVTFFHHMLSSYYASILCLYLFLVI